MPKTKKLQKSRNPELAKGIPKFSQHAMYRRSGSLAIKKAGKKFVTPAAKPATEKKAGYYPTEKKRQVRSSKPNPTHLRKSITPGTVLILLAGRFRGSRVVFLKQLKSGLLLVTGPYSLNGVPVRRVNQAYVIATSTKINISGLDTKQFKDEQFHANGKSRAQHLKERRGFVESQKAGEKAKPLEVSAEQKAFRETMNNFDKQVTAVISQTPLLDKYLQSRFVLTRGQYPHEMKF